MTRCFHCGLQDDSQERYFSQTLDTWNAQPVYAPAGGGAAAAGRGGKGGKGAPAAGGGSRPAAAEAALSRYAPEEAKAAMERSTKGGSIALAPEKATLRVPSLPGKSAVMPPGETEDRLAGVRRASITSTYTYSASPNGLP